MKLVRYGRAGAEKPGLIDAEGTLRDLSRVVRDLTPAALSPAGQKRLRAVKTTRLPVVRGRPRLGCPLAGIGKIVCVGLNYTDHASEVGQPLPEEPVLFIKATSAVTGPHDPIVRPRGATKLDYEVELGVVIGRDARDSGRGQLLTARVRGSTRTMAFVPPSVTHGAPSGPTITPCGAAPAPSGVRSTFPVAGSRRPSLPSRWAVYQTMPSAPTAMSCGKPPGGTA